MRLPDDRYEFIKREVIHLLGKYQVDCIPVSGFELLTKMGITLRPYSSLSAKALAKALEVSADGFYIDSGTEEIVFYNDVERSYSRIDMTLKHEAGHAALGHTGTKDKADEEEAEAAFFAKYASAPPPLVHRIRPRSASDLIEPFGLSYEAAEYAYGYYRKWLRYGARQYLPYEMDLLKLFSATA